MSEKLFTPKEAAMAVLKKTEELLKASSLAKAEIQEKDADQKAQGAGPKGEIKPNEKEQAPADGVQASDQPSDSIEERNGNPGPGANPTNYGEDYKGHLKLAQWMGRMSHKRGLKKKPQEQA